MDKKDEKVVNDFVARRTHQRKQAGEKVYDGQPIMEAADDITKLFGTLATRLSAEDLLVAIYLSERALYAVIRASVGEGHTDDIRKSAIRRATKEFSLTDKGVPDEAKTLFEDEVPDGE
jgi:hypothetical protein